MTAVVLALAMMLAILALLAFAVGAVAFLVQTSRHKPSKRWIVAAGVSMALLLVSSFGKDLLAP